METIKINGIEWEEITQEEFLKDKAGISYYDYYEGKGHYLKKKEDKEETFPIVFKHQGWENRRFEVDEDGDIHFISNENDEFVFENYRDELELLYKAVEKSKELRK